MGHAGYVLNYSVSMTLGSSKRDVKCVNRLNGPKGRGETMAGWLGDCDPNSMSKGPSIRVAGACVTGLGLVVDRHPDG